MAYWTNSKQKGRIKKRCVVPGISCHTDVFKCLYFWFLSLPSDHNRADSGFRWHHQHSGLDQQGWQWIPSLIAPRIYKRETAPCVGWNPIRTSPTVVMCNYESKRHIRDPFQWKNEDNHQGELPFVIVLSINHAFFFCGWQKSTKIVLLHTFNSSFEKWWLICSSLAVLFCGESSLKWQPAACFQQTEYFKFIVCFSLGVQLKKNKKRVIGALTSWAGNRCRDNQKWMDGNLHNYCETPGLYVMHCAEPNFTPG